jgi:hypothetical protein
MFRAAPNHLIAAFVAVALLGLAEPAFAQGIGIGLDLGGLGGVDVDLGGDSGVGVGVNVGGDDGLDLDVGVGGDNGLDLDLGVGGDDGLGLDVDLDGSSLDLVPDGLALTQAAASEAVKNNRALPLDEILLRARLLTDGDIIDAQLIAVQDVLLYELKVLGKAGDVSELYFYARSGLPVETN